MLQSQKIVNFKFYMSMLKMPKIIAQKIVNLQRKFFWGESSGGKMSIPIINWSSIELPKNLGGLGVGYLMYKNLILLIQMVVEVL